MMNLSHMIKPRSRNRRIPTIKISLDELINETFTQLSDNRLQSILQSRVPASNELIMEYIRSIYENYEIQDPLERTQISKSRRKGKLSASEEKIMKMKQDVKNSTPSTEKRLTSTASIKKRIVNPVQHRNNIHFTQNQQQQVSPPRLSYTHHATHSQINTTVNMTVNTASLQVQPIFRYCVICQLPILQSNILSHEGKCPEFKRLYTCSNQEIVSLLMQKITRIKSQINSLISSDSVLIKKQQQQTIKTAVREWINTIDQSLAQLFFSMKYQRLYEDMITSFTNPSYTLFELTKKLKWFIRIREQLNRKFNI